MKAGAVAPVRTNSFPSKVVVYVAPTKQFRTIKTFDDLTGLLAQGDSDSVARIVSELHLHVA